MSKKHKRHKLPNNWSPYINGYHKKPEAVLPETDAPPETTTERKEPDYKKLLVTFMMLGDMFRRTGGGGMTY